MDEELHSPKPGNGACSGRPSRRRGRRRAATAALADALDAVPAARAGMVQRAKELVRDPGYPSEETLWLIAQLLATRIEAEPQSF